MFAILCSLISGILQPNAAAALKAMTEQLEGSVFVEDEDGENEVSALISRSSQFLTDSCSDRSRKRCERSAKDRYARRPLLQSLWILTRLSYRSQAFGHRHRRIRSIRYGSHA